MAVLLTRAEAARRARVSIAELEQAIRAHELPTVRGYGVPRIQAEEVDRWRTRRIRARQGGIQA
jgi:hypothetical protein